MLQKERKEERVEVEDEGEKIMAEEELAKRNQTKKPPREVAEGAADVEEAEVEAREKTIRTRGKTTTTTTEITTTTDADAGGAVEEDVGEITITTTGGET